LLSVLCHRIEGGDVSGPTPRRGNDGSRRPLGHRRLHLLGSRTRPRHVTSGFRLRVRIDLDVINTLAPQAMRLGEALTALAATALTLRAWVFPHVPPWTLVGQITRGRLVGPPVPARPG
jgi:hypothetical protein